MTRTERLRATWGLIANQTIRKATTETSANKLFQRTTEAIPESPFSTNRSYNFNLKSAIIVLRAYPGRIAKVLPSENVPRRWTINTAQRIKREPMSDVEFIQVAFNHIHVFLDFDSPDFAFAAFDRTHSLLQSQQNFG